MAGEKGDAAVRLVVEADEGSSDCAAPTVGCVASGRDSKGRFSFVDAQSDGWGARVVDVGCLASRLLVADSCTEYVGSVLLV